RAEDALAEEAGRARLFERFLEAFVDFPDLAVDIVVADRNTHGIGSDCHAFDDDVRIVAQDVAIFEGTRLALVRVADEVLLAREGTRHEAPLQSRGKARPASAAQAGSLDFGDDVLGRHAADEDLAQGFIAAAGDVVLQMPVAAVQTGHDLGRNMAAVQPGGNRESRSVHGASPACVFNSSSNASRRASDICTHMRLLLTSSTGESPQAPMHSPSISVNMPSAVVSRKSMPSLRLRWSAAFSPSRRAQGKLVQTEILNLPTGLTSYML